MKAIQIKVSANLTIAKIAREVAMKVSHHSLTIGILGAAISYFGCLLSVDAVMYTGALMALIAIRPSVKEGGEG